MTVVRAGATARTACGAARRDAAAAAPRVHTVRRTYRGAAAGRIAGRRPDLDVGRAAVRAAAGPRRRHGRQGGEPGPPGRHPRRRSALLRLDERWKALLCSRFRPRPLAGWRHCWPPPMSCSRGRGPLRWPAAVWAHRTCPARAGRVWLRITGYGTEAGSAERVAFGDDAAVAGGLVGYDGAGPVFVGDAIADPLTGLEAAAAVCAFAGPRRRRTDRRRDGRGGGDLRRAAGEPDAPDVVTDRCCRPCARPAPALGADNAAVERLVADRPFGEKPSATC